MGGKNWGMEYLYMDREIKRSLMGYSPWGLKSWTRLSDYTTSRAHSSVKICVVIFHIIAASVGNCTPGGGKWNRVQKESLLL